MKKSFDRQQAEHSELNRLIGTGLAFELERTISKRKKGLKGFIFRQRTTEKEKLTFHVDEPTLSTLDRIASEQIDLVIDENVMISESGLTEAKKLTAKHCRRLAKIIAYAVLGQDYVHAIQEGSRVKYSYDDTKLNELTDLFFHNIKPSKLMELVVLINTMSNLGDFCNSIRLMSAERTMTKPTRIEENKKA